MLPLRQFTSYITQGYSKLTDPGLVLETELDVELGSNKVDTETYEDFYGRFDSPIALYRRLCIPPGSRFIRVLELDGLPKCLGSDSMATTSPLTGRLKIISLSHDSPSFSSLSYTWGRSSVSHHTITCNGCTFQITSNLFEALQQIRRQHGRLLIWIDAICINQKDEREKTEQIPLMNEIYSKAQNVYVWLGNGTIESDAAMDSLREAWEIKSLMFGNGSGLISMSTIYHLPQQIKFWRKLLLDPVIYWWICECRCLVVASMPLISNSAYS
jgi:hypothetical protein